MSDPTEKKLSQALQRLIKGSPTHPKVRAKLEKRPSLRDRLNAAKEECAAQVAPEKDISRTGPER